MSAIPLTLGEIPEEQLRKLMLWSPAELQHCDELSYEQFSAAYHMTLQTVRHLASKGVLPVRKRPGGPRIDNLKYRQTRDKYPYSARWERYLQELEEDARQEAEIDIE